MAEALYLGVDVLDCAQVAVAGTWDEQYGQLCRLLSKLSIQPSASRDTGKVCKNIVNKMSGIVLQG